MEFISGAWMYLGLLWSLEIWKEYKGYSRRSVLPLHVFCRTQRNSRHKQHKVATE